MVISAQQTAPFTPRSSGADTYANYSRPASLTKSLATSMPSDRQTSQGLVHPEYVPSSSGDYEKWKKSKIFNPKQSASAITSENFFKAKADFSPIFMHNIGATKRALISVMEEDKPRHSEKVNILA
jgi:hypothetical protein